MRKEVRIGVSLLAGLVLAVAVCTLVPSRVIATTVSAQTPATQSVSGKIASVEKDSFTLTVASEKSNFDATGTGAKTMTFHLDQNTAIEGTLKVGANADVTYRQDGGKNIAISVHVS